MLFSIPELSFVVLIGASGAGKSTFARKHFKPTEVLSSDFCRGLVSDDENDLNATRDAFEVLHFIARKRLATGKLTVVDATNVQHDARTPLVAIAREFHCLPVAIVLDFPERLCQERNANRPDRAFGQHVVRQHISQLRRSLHSLQREGFRHIFVLHTPEEVDAVSVERQPLWNNRKHEHGPFDIIGDVHGCCDELEALLALMGYVTSMDAESGVAAYCHPDGRRAIFLGDLVDRGPRVLDTVALAQRMVAAGSAICVPGNHDMKFMRMLQGKDVKVNFGLEQSVAEINALPADVKEATSKELIQFFNSLVSHYVFDDGKLVVAHAGMKEEMQGRGSARVRDFALYGETTGETDEFGLPVRHNWASDYRGSAIVVYGHTPVPEAEWLNGAINIDTGCVFGGRLTALRYPERELLAVPAARVYTQPARPLTAPTVPAPTAQQLHDDVLDIQDVLDKRILSTRLMPKMTIRAEQAVTALEVMSRFAVDPKWLIYLPPTMSPTETTTLPGLLEHPAEGFAYYRQEGVPRVVCEEKHMGSRAVVVLCRDEAAARSRFNVTGGEAGCCYTRTGRRFFDDSTLERAFFERLRSAVAQAGLWDEFATDWICLDCELMPWSAKARELLRRQYAAVGAASRGAFDATTSALQQVVARGVDAQALLERYRDRASMAGRYVDAYRRYCWPVVGLDDLKLAPFHLLATEGTTHMQQSHVWHMEHLARLCSADNLLLATPHRIVDVTDPVSQDTAIQWWQELTAHGGEGIVIKPEAFTVRGARGVVQPAVKCRGKEYLRIIYGPEYSAPEHLERLRQRGIGAKRSLAVREFALGVEALERFVRREPLRRVHECVFGVLALESEPVDPRL